jgi:hypothetical protein
VLRGVPAAHIGADLGYQLERGRRTDGIDLAEVGASESMQRGADVKAGLTVLKLSWAPRRRQCGWARRLRCGDGCERRCDGDIAISDLL